VCGATTAAVLQQFLFFHASEAPFKASISFNFLNVGGGPFKNTHRKVVERWLYGALTGTAQLLSGGSTIYPRSVGPVDYVRPEGNRSSPYVPLEGGRPD
jgi:hypothetical protein